VNVFLDHDRQTKGQNNINDIYLILSFLRINHFHLLNSFRNAFFFMTTELFRSSGI